MSLIVWGCLGAITVLAWLYLIHLDREMAAAASMPEMDMPMDMAMNRPWTVADVFFAAVMWTVMMIGMMAGSAAPVVSLFSAARRSRGDAAPSSVVLFAAGYLLVWTGFSVAAALAQWGLHAKALLSPAMAVSTTRLAALIVIAAGVYQLTPAKSACLAHCRSPLGFLMTHWRDGALGAVRMGVSHGTYCVGCCWALMIVLFAVGVMNLVWVAALTALVLVEKLTRHGAIVAKFAGGLMIVYGATLMWRA